MLRDFFFRVHSRVSRAQSDFKFVSASCRNQHASGVRSPEVAADTAAATTKRLGKARRLQFTPELRRPFRPSKWSSANRVAEVRRVSFSSRGDAPAMRLLPISAYSFQELASNSLGDVLISGTIHKGISRRRNS